MDTISQLTQIPVRLTPKWESSEKVLISNKGELAKVATGKAPVGILPTNMLIHTEKERVNILNGLNKIASAKYDGSEDDQKVSNWGQPWSDSKTLEEHLSVKINETILDYCNLFVDRLTQYLENLGFTVDRLRDPVTNLNYHAGVFRMLNVSNNHSVLHIDDFMRVAQKKKDFRIPEILENRLYYQMSFNILLEDGGYPVNPLYTYNRFYTPADEAHCMENGWQFPLSLVEEEPVCQYRPKLGDSYVFSTTAYHDIRGGSPHANRITWSVFGLLIPELNTVILYS